MRSPARASIVSRIAVTLMLLVVFGTSGCATILHGTTQKVSITSQPPGANGLIEPAGIKIVTPAKVELRRKQSYTVHFELSGYKPENAYLYRVFSPAAHGNLLIGGLIGLAKDLENGAAFELTPDPLQTTLVRDPQYSPDVSGDAVPEREGAQY